MIRKWWFSSSRLVCDKKIIVKKSLWHVYLRLCTKKNWKNIEKYRFINFWACSGVKWILSPPWKRGGKNTKNVYEEISEISHLNWRQKVKNFFWRAHLRHTIFSTRINPQNHFQLVNTPIWKRCSLNFGATNESLCTAHVW